MGDIFNSVPTSVFLIATIVIPVLITINLVKNRRKYNFFLCTGIILGMSTVFMAGINRMIAIEKVDIFQLDWFRITYFISLIVTILLICIGALTATRYDTRKRKLVIFSTLLIIISLFGLILIVVVKS